MNWQMLSTIVIVVTALVGLKLLTRWTDRKGWTSFYKLSTWRAIGTFATGWEQYFRPGLHKAEEYRVEIHDEEDGDNRKKS